MTRLIAHKELIKRHLGNYVLKTQRLFTSVGERFGWQWMVYNPLVLYGFERAACRNAPIVARAIRESFPMAKSCIDVGCGTGRYVEDLQKTGIHAVGVEFSPRLRRKCRRRGVEAFPFDVSVPTPYPPSAPYCLAMSLEVAEHISPALADSTLKTSRRA